MNAVVACGCSGAEVESKDDRNNVMLATMQHLGPEVRCSGFYLFLLWTCWPEEYMIVCFP